MPFGAFPYHDRDTIKVLSSRLMIRTVPTVVMLGPRRGDRDRGGGGGGDRPIINEKVRQLLETPGIDGVMEYPFFVR
jgi:hypothetical protein